MIGSKHAASMPRAARGKTDPARRGSHTRLIPAAPGDSPALAFRDLCYAAGVPALAEAMGVATGTLYNKADASPDSHNQPTLRDVVLATRLTGDTRVLDALDRAFGRVGVDVSGMGQVSDEALLDLLTHAGREVGDAHAALHRALQGDFSQTDVAALADEVHELVAAWLTLLKRVQGIGAAGEGAL